MIWNRKQKVNHYEAEQLEKKKHIYGKGDLFFHQLNSSKGMDSILLGYNILENSWIEKSLDKHPHSLFIGKSGSGKSICLARIIMSYYLKNSQNSLFFLIDSFRGMHDSHHILSKPSVIPIFGDSEAIKAITVVYEEVLSRKKSKELDYDRVFLVIENFHTIMDIYLNYEKEKDTPGSPSYMLKEILTYGGKFKVNVMVATEKSSYSDIPEDLIRLFSNRLFFNTETEESFRFFGNQASYNLTQSYFILDGKEYLSPYISHEDWTEVFNEKKAVK